MMLLGIATSLASCTLASTNYFLSQRGGYYGDYSASLRKTIIYFVFTFSITTSILMLWSYAFYYGNIMTGVAFILYLLVTLVVILCWKRLKNQGKNANFLLAEVASSWVAPYSPWMADQKGYFAQLFFKLIGASLLPIGLALGLDFWLKTDYKVTMFNHFGITYYCIPALVAIFASLVVQAMADYSTLFKISKILRLCAMKPIIHRSLIFDYLRIGTEGISNHSPANIILGNFTKAENLHFLNKLFILVPN